MMVTPSMILLALLAQAAPVSSASPDGRAKAQLLLTEGARLYEDGDVASALEKFEAAYAEFASPKLLFNIGQASRNLGRLAEAITAFERFIAESPESSGEMTNEARASVEELRTKLGRLRIECTPADAEISVDGKTPPPGANVIWAMPGWHQVTAKHPDRTPVVENVEVMVGGVQNVVLRLAPLGRAASLASPKRGAGPRATPVGASEEELARRSVAKSQHGLWMGRTWTWLAAGSAVAFAGTGVALGLSMRSRFNDLDRSCGSGSAGYPGCSDADIDSVKTLQTTANVFYGLSVAAAVTAGVLFVVEGGTVSVSPMAGPINGLSAQMTY